ncbi:MAG: hypothetical protein QXS20_01355 [Candidatus Thorarchaeota archaeon]
MVIRLIARVELDTMNSDILYPREGSNDQRIALLTGVTQLVSSALERAGSRTTSGQPMFMKAETGVIGYILRDRTVFICEGDGERETGDALQALYRRAQEEQNDLAAAAEDILSQKGKEIGDLWR